MTGDRPASLPMYDLPELRPATDAWWRGLAGHLRAAGLENVPDVLTRPTDMAAHWRDPALLISQTCGFPLTHDLAGAVTYVATPHYDAAGCEGPRYRSRIVARADAPGETLADFAGARVAFNGPESQSGANALRAAIAELADTEAAPENLIAETVKSGGHRASLAAVREGRADLCAVDGVTCALIERVAPAEVAPLKTVGWTPDAPGLPYITAAGVPPARLAALRAGLEAAFADPALAESRAALLLAGVSVLDLEAYSGIPAMRRTADAHAVPQLV